MFINSRCSRAFFVAILGASYFPAFFLSAAEPAQTNSVLETDPQGWVDILPAEDLKGWFRVPVPSNSRLGRDQWHVDGKLLICDGDGGQQNDQPRLHVKEVHHDVCSLGARLFLPMMDATPWQVQALGRAFKNRKLGVLPSLHIS